jgi:hypothetical protein
MLLKRFTCIEGQDDAVRHRIAEALGEPGDETREPG